MFSFRGSEWKDNHKMPNRISFFMALLTVLYQRWSASTMNKNQTEWATQQPRTQKWQYFYNILRLSSHAMYRGSGCGFRSMRCIKYAEVKRQKKNSFHTWRFIFFPCGSIQFHTIQHRRTHEVAIWFRFCLPAPSAYPVAWHWANITRRSKVQHRKFIIDINWCVCV